MEIDVDQNQQPGFYTKKKARSQGEQIRKINERCNKIERKGCKKESVNNRGIGGGKPRAQQYQLSSS